MVRPSSAHWARLPLTTKQVNGGYYKGNRTGSMGAHTEWGGYVIDYRKARNFNCPNLENNRLTPFITSQVAPPKWEKMRKDGTFYRPNHRDGRALITAWRKERPLEYDRKRREWKSYLELIGEIPVSRAQRPKPQEPLVDESLRTEAREDAMVQLEEESSKSKSRVGRAFKR